MSIWVAMAGDLPLLASVLVAADHRLWQASTAELLSLGITLRVQAVLGAPLAAGSARAHNTLR